MMPTTRLYISSIPFPRGVDPHRGDYCGIDFIDLGNVRSAGSGGYGVNEHVWSDSLMQFALSLPFIVEPVADSIYPFRANAADGRVIFFGASIKAISGDLRNILVDVETSVLLD